MATLQQALGTLMDVCASTGGFISQGLEVWLQAVEDLPLQKQNPHTAPAVEAVSAALRQVRFSRAGDARRELWLEEHLPKFSPAMAAYVQKQLELTVRRVDILEQLQQSERQLGSEQIPARIAAEAATYWNLQAAFNVVMYVKPIEGVLNALQQPLGQAMPRGQRHRRGPPRQPALVLLAPEEEEVNRLLGGLEAWLRHWACVKAELFNATIGRLHERLEAMCRAFSCRLSDFDTDRLYLQVMHWSAYAASPLIQAALELPYCPEHGCAASLLLVMEWLAYLHGLREIKALRGNLPHILARQDLREVLTPPLVPLQIITNLLREDGMSLEEVQAVCEDEMWSPLQELQALGAFDPLPSACESAQGSLHHGDLPSGSASAAEEGSEGPHSGNDPYDMQELLRMMYGTSNVSDIDQ